MTSVAEIIENDNVIGPLLEKAISSDHWNKSSRNGHTHRSVSILKYRPHRRLCAKLSTTETHILKIWYNTRGSRIYRNLCNLNECLSERSAPVLIPQPLFYDAEAHALAYLAVDGEQATPIFKRGRSRDWISPVANALAALHQSSVADLKFRSPEDELKSISSQMAGLPGSSITDAIHEFTNKMGASQPKTNRLSLLHRDLYDQQILFTADGAIYLIDLDDMASGDGMLDIGNFLAHFHLMKHWQRRPEKFARMRGRFLREYAAVVGRGTEELRRNLDWYEAVALARLSAIQLKKGKRELAQILLHNAKELCG